LITVESFGSPSAGASFQAVIWTPQKSPMPFVYVMRIALPSPSR
jgi:hypothetical protein